MEIFLLLAMLGWLYSNIYYTITINRLKKQNKEFKQITGKYQRGFRELDSRPHTNLAHSDSSFIEN